MAGIETSRCFARGVVGVSRITESMDRRVHLTTSTTRNNATWCIIVCSIYASSSGRSYSFGRGHEHYLGSEGLVFGGVPLGLLNRPKNFFFLDSSGKRGSKIIESCALKRLSLKESGAHSGARPWPSASAPGRRSHPRPRAPRALVAPEHAPHS